MKIDVDKLVSPRFLDIVDMPTDGGNVGTLRTELCKAVSQSRGNPDRIENLKEILQYSYARLVQITKADEEEAEARAKKQAEANVDSADNNTDDKE